MDLLSLHVKLTEVVFRALRFLEEYDCETVGKRITNVPYDADRLSGNPQTAVSHLGDVVLLVQYVVVRYRVGISPCFSGWCSLTSGQLSPNNIFLNDQTASASYLFSSTSSQDPGTMSIEEATAFASWFKALFDSSSEGIEDTIFR